MSFWLVLIPVQILYSPHFLVLGEGESVRIMTPMVSRPCSKCRPQLSHATTKRATSLELHAADNNLPNRTYKTTHQTRTNTTTEQRELAPLFLPSFKFLGWHPKQATSNANSSYLRSRSARDSSRGVTLSCQLSAKRVIRQQVCNIPIRKPGLWRKEPFRDMLRTRRLHRNERDRFGRARVPMRLLWWMDGTQRLD
jgi:hypothetical protein